MTTTDFEQLARQAFPQVDQPGPVEALDQLWNCLFDLPCWYFLAIPANHDSDQGQPFQWDRRMDGKFWLLAFTELERGQAFAAKQNLP